MLDRLPGIGEIFESLDQLDHIRSRSGTSGRSSYAELDCRDERLEFRRSALEVDVASALALAHSALQASAASGYPPGRHHVADLASFERLFGRDVLQGLDELDRLTCIIVELKDDAQTSRLRTTLKARRAEIASGVTEAVISERRVLVDG